MVCSLTYAWAETANPGPAQPKPASHEEQQNAVSNPFTPGGVVGGDQVISRAEVEKLLAEQETRLKKELNGGMTADEISKMVTSAASTNAAQNSDNFIGCVNGIPLYRMDDGTLTEGTQGAESVKLQRCGK